MERARDIVHHDCLRCKLYRMQKLLGRCYVHGHRSHAMSWSVNCVETLIGESDAIKTRAEQCQYGLITTKNGVTGFAKRPTDVFTESEAVAKQLCRRCPDDHEHIHFDKGRVELAEEYSKGLCDAVCVWE